MTESNDVNKDINVEIATIKAKIEYIQSDSKHHQYAIDVIQEKQNVLAKETVDIISVIATKTDANQITTMNAIEDLKKSQKKWWKNLHPVIKIIIILLLMSYVAGSYFAYIRSI